MRPLYRHCNARSRAELKHTVRHVIDDNYHLRLTPTDSDALRGSVFRRVVVFVCPFVCYQGNATVIPLSHLCGSSRGSLRL